MTCRPRSPIRPCTALADGDRRAQRRLRLRLERLPDIDDFNASNYWVDVVFADRCRARHDAADRRQHLAPQRGATGVSRRRAHQRAKFSEPVAAATVDGSTFQLSTTGSQPGSRDRHLRRRLPHCHAHAQRRRSPTRPPIRRRSRAARAASRTSPATPMAADRTWSFTTAARHLLRRDEGPGGPILVISSGRQPVQPRTTPRSSGPRASTSSRRPTSPTWTLHVLVAVRRSSSWATSPCPARQAATAVRLGQRRRQPDRHAPRRRPGRAARAHRCRRDAVERLPAGRHHAGPGRGLVDQTIQFHGTADLYTLDAGTARLATLYSDATTATVNPAVTPAVGRHKRRPGGGVHLRPGALGRPDPPGQPGTGSGRSATATTPIRSDDLFFGAQGRRPPARLGRPEQGRHPAGGRAAAPAGQPDRDDERGQHRRCRASGTSHATRRPSS